MATIWLALTVLALARQVPATPQELRQAEADVPELVRVLELRPGMTVADVGAGGGAITLVLAKWIGPAGRVFSTELNEKQVAAIRDQVTAARLDNVTVLAGAASSTNLPDNCCDAIVLRDVYHHLTDPAAIDRSLLAALRPGGRLAIIDFAPRPNSQPQVGLPSDRTGHGITADAIVRESTREGLTLVRTIDTWPPQGREPGHFLVLLRKRE